MCQAFVAQLACVWERERERRHVYVYMHGFVFVCECMGEGEGGRERESTLGVGTEGDSLSSNLESEREGETTIERERKFIKMNLRSGAVADSSIIKCGVSAVMQAARQECVRACV